MGLHSITLENIRILFVYLGPNNDKNKNILQIHVISNHYDLSTECLQL